MSAGNLLSCAKVLRKVKEAEQKFEEVEIVVITQSSFVPFGHETKTSVNFGDAL